MSREYRQEVEASLSKRSQFQQTAKELRISPIKFYSKQHRTTSLLDRLHKESVLAEILDVKTIKTI